MNKHQYYFNHSHRLVTKKLGKHGYGRERQGYQFLTEFLYLSIYTVYYLWFRRENFSRIGNEVLGYEPRGRGFESSPVRHFLHISLNKTTASAIAQISAYTKE